MKTFLYFMIFIIFTSCNNEDHFQIIGGHYKFNYNPRSEIALKDNNIKDGVYDIVEGHILFYCNNSDFIIASQKPKDSIKKPFGLDYDQGRNLVFKSNYSQYWIITLKNDSLYGPYKKEEYLKERKKLGIPDNFKLNRSTLEFYIEGQRLDIEYEKPDSDIVDIPNLKGNKVSKMLN
jgi:hypothetical protein